MTAIPQEHPRTDRKDIDLVALVQVLWRRKLLIVLCIILFTAAGIFHVASTYPVYRSDTLIQLEQRNIGPIIFQTPLNETEVTTSTEVELISSRMVLGQAVAENDLDWYVLSKKAPIIGNILARYNLPIPEWSFLAPYSRKGEQLILTNLRTPPEWVGRQIVVTTIENGYSLLLPDGSHHEGQVGEDLALEALGFAINIKEHPDTPGREFMVVQWAERTAIQSLRSRLSITERGRGSGILELKLTGTDPQEVERSLGAIATAYVQQNIRRGVAEAESGLEFIRSQLPDAELKLNNAQAALNRFREDASDRARAQDWPDAAIQQSFETQALLNQITRIEADLRRSELEVTQNRDLYNEDHPMLRKSLIEQGELESALTQLLARVDDLPEVQREVVNLTRDVELAQQIYFDLQARSQEMQVLQASAVGSVRIVDPATASSSPIAPRKSLILSSYILISLFFGMSLSLALHWAQRGVRGSQELERMGLPVFSTIPQSQLFKDCTRSNSIAAFERPDDLAVEALRSLRTSLHFGMLGSKTKAVVLTSAAPGAGKTTTAINLAVIAAQAGQKVALIDADLRRGQLRKFFGLERRTLGLSDVLASKITLSSALTSTYIPNLCLLSSGRYPPNPSELLMRNEMTSVLTHLEEDFDLVIIDTPPVLAVTDPVILSHLAGTTILVVRHGVSAIREIEAVKKVFDLSGLRIAGSILNGFDPRKAESSEMWGGYDYQYTYKSDTGMTG